MQRHTKSCLLLLPHRAAPESPLHLTGCHLLRCKRAAFPCSPLFSPELRGHLPGMSACSTARGALQCWVQSLGPRCIQTRACGPGRMKTPQGSEQSRSIYCKFIAAPGPLGSITPKGVYAHVCTHIRTYMCVGMCIRLK